MNLNSTQQFVTMLSTFKDDIRCCNYIYCDKNYVKTDKVTWNIKDNKIFRMCNKNIFYFPDLDVTGLEIKFKKESNSVWYKMSFQKDQIGIVYIKFIQGYIFFENKDTFKLT